MDWVKNESAFTFIEMLLILSFIMISLPLITFFLHKIQYEDNQDHISVQQFFTFIQHDALTAEDVYQVNNRLFFAINEFETASIEIYKDLIRRRVNNKGHEIYLRDMQSLHIEPLEFGFHVTVMTSKGALYEKTIIANPS